MNHLVLLGDSILDNGAYTGSGPDVCTQLRGIVSPGDRVTLLAVDGDSTRDVPNQLGKLPSDATHLFLSIGGNDALENAGLLQESAHSFAEVLMRLAEVAGAFAKSHREVVEKLVATGLPTTICTVYDANFQDPFQAQIIKAALTHWNDAILRNAFAAGLPVIDLRVICDSPADYANDIEPSSQGGEKIARAILRVTREHSFERAISGIYC
ncbi:MAG TPA: GDSL-type esterase/lipase family protein [Abditibacterium sp.]